MFQISRYLERFRKLDRPEKDIEKNASELFERELGISVNPETLSIQGRTLRVLLPSAAKSEIFMRIDFFQEELKKISHGRIIEIR